MVRLDLANLEQNTKRFVGVAEGVCAITLNKNDTVICGEHAQSLIRPFLAIRKCKMAVFPDAINVSLDGTTVAWSPNLHLRLLRLWRESSDFRRLVSSEPKDPTSKKQITKNSFQNFKFKFKTKNFHKTNNFKN